MIKAIKYTIFKTKWGYFGLAGGDTGLSRTCLPLDGPEKAKSQLLEGLSSPVYDKTLFKTAQEQIIVYFEGAWVDFRNIPVTLEGSTPFQRFVLAACRNIEFGRTISYAGLARKIGSPAAARAVGGALAKNPLPLIIPCHRIVHSDGKIGGFSALGGATLKRKMLLHEKQHCQ